MKNVDDVSLIDLDDDLLSDAIVSTNGREYTDEEVEDLALLAFEQSQEFKELEEREAQGLWNYPFQGSDILVPVDENGEEIIPTDIQVLKFLSSKLVRRELAFLKLIS